ncbi:flippase [Paenibacillus rhizoplanae]|uniref:flippase n=1 Tax=Paenibacillus rhizoplanae TaxID=1917181 RepID=UPI003612D411
MLRIIGGGILIILSSIFIRLIEPNDSMLHILVLIMSFSMLIKSFEVIEYWIQAYQLAKVTSIIHIMTTLITAILKIGLIIFNGGLIAFALIYTIDAILISIALTISYFKLRENRSFWKVSIVYGRGILRQSWYLILSGLMITMYMRLDQVMLGYMMDTKVELGIYSASARIAEMWYFIPMAVITSFRPVIMKKKGDNIDYIDSIQKLYKIIAWMGILIGIIIIILAKPIILILYGVDYLSASKILSVSIWAGTFAMLGSARSIWLVCEGLQKFTLAYTFGGLIVNIILNYFLIPHYGAFGAAVATLVSQFFANIVVLSLFKKTRISSIMILKSFIPKFHLKK